MDTPPPPPPSIPPPPPPPATPAPKKGSNKALVIVLCILGFLFLVIAGCVGACFYGVKKAKDYGEAAQRNPQFAAISLAASFNPDVQVISKDEAANRIKLRNKKTGEVVEIDTSAYSTENITKALEQFAKGMKLPPPDASGTAEESSSTTVETPSPSNSSAPPSDKSKPAITPARAAALADVVKTFPNYAPAYPNGTTQEATLNTVSGFTAGTYAFTTTDAPEKVVAFYEKKLSAAGNFTVASKSSDTNDYGAASHLMANRANPPATFVINAESQAQGIHVVVTFTQR